MKIGVSTIVLFCLGLAIAAALDGGWTFLPLGFFIGMAHALDADHLAAVAALTDRYNRKSRAIVRGVVWGIGHTLSLFVICGLVVGFGLTISGRLEAALELSVGLMILALGLRVFFKLCRQKIHIHVHEHDGYRHVHAHSHASDTVRHSQSEHQHFHVSAREHLPVFGVGLLHGAAGSAGLLVLTVATTQSIATAFGYFVIFGIGSLLGMAALSAAASLPLQMVHRGASWMKTATASGIGAFAVWVGGSLTYSSLMILQVAGLP